MEKKLIWISFGLSFLCFYLRAQVPSESHGFALKVGKILTVTQGIIHHGTVLIENGKYLQIGKNLEIPAHFQVMELPEYWMMPGFIDLHSHIGASTDLWDTVLPLNHDLELLPAIVEESKLFVRAIRGGVTTLLVIPGSGANFAGFGVLLKPFGKSLAEMVLRYPGAMKVAQAYNPERRDGDFGVTRMGMSWGMRYVLEKGKHYHEAWVQFEAGKTTTPPKKDPELELLRGLFQRKYPVLVHTAGSRDVMSTMRMFHDDYHLWVVLSHGCFDAYKVAPEFARRGLHLNLGPRLYDYYFARERRMVNLAQQYNQAEVNFSLCTDAPVIPQVDLSLQATLSARLGLNEEKALAALTINPARAIGIGDRVGSIEVGKDADFILKKGSPFDVRIPMEWVFINGKKVYDRAEEIERDPSLQSLPSPILLDCCSDDEAIFLEEYKRDHE
ncbi:MAG: amidohydrolase family protein [Planctomycetota bacterium]